MAINKNYNPVEIQHYLFTLLDDKVSFNTYMTNAPIKLTATDTDFVVIGLPTPLRDYEAYGTIKVMVEIFVKADERGLQNNVRLRDLQNKFNEIIDTENDSDIAPYIICRTLEGAFIDYDEAKGYHVLINTFNIIIK